MADSILVTKLFIPPSRPDRVPRPRLIELLRSNLDRKLILISAPAGFGKTTLVTDWLKASANSGAMSVAWLSLDHGDNDPVRFLTYFVAGLNRLAGMDVAAGDRKLAQLREFHQ